MSNEDEDYSMQEKLVSELQDVRSVPASKFPLVSLIVINFNGVKTLGATDLEGCIVSFLSTDYPDFEFIFVDNGSKDESIAVAERLIKLYPKVSSRVISLNSNMGFAGGCNRALTYAKGEYIVLINNDNRAASPIWLRELVITARAFNSGVCSSKCLKWDNPQYIDSIGLVIDPIGTVRSLGEGLLENGQFNQMRQVLVWQTPVLIKRSIIPAIGGLFDDDYVILHDDTDMSWRVWLTGYSILFVPLSKAYHKRSATMKKLPPLEVIFHGRKNMLLTVIKNYDNRNLIKYVPMVVFVLLGASLLHLKDKRKDLFLGTLNAISWNLSSLPKTMRKRAAIQLLRRRSDKEILRLFDRLDPIRIYRNRWRSLNT